MIIIWMVGVCRNKCRQEAVWCYGHCSAGKIWFLLTSALMTPVSWKHCFWFKLLWEWFEEHNIEFSSNLVSNFSRTQLSICGQTSLIHGGPTSQLWKTCFSHLGSSAHLQGSNVVGPVVKMCVFTHTAGCVHPSKSIMNIRHKKDILNY